MTTGASFKSVSKPTTNEAVQFCLDIWRDAYEKGMAAGKTEYFAAQDAHDAYREAMPDLTSFSDIQDFIACVGRGILVKAINDSEASKLLVAARIASQAFASSEKAVLKAVAQSQAGYSA
jgi:hypothetical protein